jgi:hypothetical protein
MEEETEVYDLPEVLAGILLSDDDDIGMMTISDFLDFMNIPEEDRFDYWVGLLQHQALVLYTNAR